MEEQDKKIECRDCKNMFFFTIGEQEFYAKKNLSTPKRCKKCRERKKQDRNNRSEKK